MPRAKPVPTAVRQSPRKRKLESEAEEPVHTELTDKAPTARGSRAKKPKTSITEDDLAVDEPARTEILKEIKGESSKSSKKKRLATPPETDKAADTKEAESPTKKRKTKKDASTDIPLAQRAVKLTHYVGAHVSIAKGVENAVTNAVHIGGNAFALFLQSQRKWENPALKDENKDAFLSACSHHGFDAKQHIVPHGSYLVNLASKEPESEKKSYDFFLNDLKRCEALGIRYYNFHPGTTNKEPLADAIKKLTKNLNKALSETTTVTPLLENMAGTETIIGSRLTDLADIIAGVKPEYQARIGICIDTCHAFAAGLDLRTPEAYEKTMKEIDDVVGLKYIKALHMNDSKGMFESRKDLHQNIGCGFIGLRGFHCIMNDPRLANIPLILETPSEKPDPKDPKKKIEDKSVWANEIKLLESLIGMDPESDEYKTLEKDLADKGRTERDEMVKWQADKENKAAKKQLKAEKGQKSINSMFGGKGKKKKAQSPSASEEESE